MAIITYDGSVLPDAATPPWTITASNATASIVSNQLQIDMDMYGSYIFQRTGIAIHSNVIGNTVETKATLSGGNVFVITIDDGTKLTYVRFMSFQIYINNVSSGSYSAGEYTFSVTMIDDTTTVNIDGSPAATLTGLDASGGTTNIQITSETQTQVNANTVGNFLMSGIVKSNSWSLVKGLPVYTSTLSSGLNISQTQPTASGYSVQILGIAKETDTIVFNPNLMTLELA